MAFYEFTFIVRPDVASNHPEQLAKKYAEVIKKEGGKILKTEQWGLRSLAYRLNKHRKGYYTMFGMEANGKVLNELERQLRISDDVIRFLSIKVEEMTKEPSIMMNPKTTRRPHKEAAPEAAAE